MVPYWNTTTLRQEFQSDFLLRLRPEAFGKLLDKEYHLVLERKNISVPLHIIFDKKECFHLIQKYSFGINATCLVE